MFEWTLEFPQGGRNVCCAGSVATTPRKSVGSKEPGRPEASGEEDETKDELVDTEFLDKLGDGEDDSQEESLEIDKGDTEGMRPRPQPRTPTKAEI